MKKWFFGAVAIAIAALFNLSNVSANDGAVAAPCCGDVLAAGDCCCASSSLVFEVEATFFRLHGTELFDDDAGPNVFDFEIAPRVTIGYVGCDGLGLRARWWYYNHSNEDDDGDNYHASVYNVDVELFEEIQLSCCTSLEWSAGVRYNHFSLDDEDDGDVYAFNAPGIIIGAKVTRQLSIGGAMYAGVKHAWLMSDDKENGDVVAFDSTHTIFEGALGYQTCYCLGNGSVVTVNAGVEMQNWSGYHGNDTQDIGFGGFVLGANWNY